MPPQDGYYPPPDQPYPEKEKKHSDTGKLLAAGAAGMAIGAVGGAFINHEIGMFFLAWAAVTDYEQKNTMMRMVAVAVAVARPRRRRRRKKLTRVETMIDGHDRIPCSVYIASLHR